MPPTTSAIKPAFEQVRLRDWLAAAAVALACLLFQLNALRPQTLQAYDQPLYLGIASDLLQTGTYTNGRFGEPGVPGAYTAPLYPAFVATIAALDSHVAQAAACARTASFATLPSCPNTLGLLLPVQLALMTGTLLMVWRTTLAIGGTGWAAWCALLAAALGTTEYAVYARTAMTEALSLPLAAVTGLLLVLIVRRVQTLTVIGLGVALGLLTLARPEYLYLTAAIALAGAAFCLRRRRLGFGLIAACILAGVVIAPWSARNERLFGTIAPTAGYAGFILAQRMAYEAMTPAEWTASWVYSLPGFGPAAAHRLFPGAVDRLGWEERPDTFYMVGNTTMVQQMKAAAPDPADQVPYLLRTYVWPHPLRFAAVTLVMAWKSLWVRKYFSLAAFPFLVVMTWQAVRRKDQSRLAFLLPLYFVVLFHAATTVATPRYSLILIPAYSAAFGLAVGPLVQRMLERRLQRAPA